ncbi:tRNA-specific adenosine deaminase 1-like [Uloborus diversus]|uniref:tRNA-specific adenosine deaminase 1-like n=1 Tax=Uloborus diversus TaxID=327109 RepID=UPI002409CF5E|nr:tRNA-specific adenosine deaminase 1-like [Uloborus diversus]
MSQTFANCIAKLCYEHFDRLPRKGKPQLNKEWTLLAAVLMSVNDLDSSLKVISMSTGTKCLGHSQLSDKGDVINDSHAEVLARRAFLRFLYYQMGLVLEKKNSPVIFFSELEKKFRIKAGVKFHFFVSHVPCGDAAIFPKNSEDEASLSSLKESKTDSEEPKCKKIKLESINDGENDNPVSKGDGDIFRTGAKCVQKGEQDPKEHGKDYHVIGALRTKPGRGDPTWSMSCSDKIALWNVCGFQGALITHFIEQPIYISTFVIGKCPFSESAFKRAMIDRLSNVADLPLHYHLPQSAILQSSLAFEYSKEKLALSDAKTVPCPASIIWYDAPGSLEVSVNGKKQGIVKKDLNKPSSRVGVCKSMLFKMFLELLKKVQLFNEYKNSQVLTYYDFKKQAKDYQIAKQAVYKIFDGWMRKPDQLQKFMIENDSHK